MSKAQLRSSGANEMFEATAPSGASVLIKRARGTWSAAASALRREAAVLKRLADPGVVRFLEHGETADGPWFAMEHVDGETLAAFLEEHWQPERTNSQAQAGAGRLKELLIVFRELVECLGRVHDAHIVHLDLTPTNVVMRRGTPVLIDFGLSASTLASSSGELTDFTHAVGTPGYAAPEVLAMEPIDSRADLYSLGCMLFEAVAGRVVFPQLSGISLARRHLQGEAPRASTVISGVPPELDDLIFRLLAREPRERLSSVQEVLATLDRLLGAPPGVRSSKPRLFRPTMVGRQEVFERLLSRTAKARAGLGGLVVLRGESGLGKTTLAREVGRHVAADFHVIGSGSPAELKGTLGTLVAAIATAAGGRVPAALSALDAETSLAASHQQIFAALRTGLTQLSDEQSVLLIFDDLHLADEMALGFLQSLPEGWVRDRRLLILVLVRVEESPAELETLLSRTDEVLQLDRLDVAAQARLIGDALALPQAPLALVNSLVAHSGGNPFFVIEMLRLAVAEDELSPTGADLWSTEWSAKFSFPASVRGLVERRLDALSDQARELTLQLAVMGRGVSEEELELLPPLQDGGPLFLELLSRQVIEPRAQGGFSFTHDKLQEVAYLRIEPERRAALHRDVARACESQRPEPMRRARILAHHWKLAGDQDREFVYAQPAGELCLRSSAWAEAAQHLRRALELAARRAIPTATLAHWHLQLARAEFGAGRQSDAEAHALIALGLLGMPIGESKTAWRWLFVRSALTQLFMLAGGARWLRVDGALRSELADAADAALLLTERHFYSDDVFKVVTLALLASTLAERASAEVPRAHAALAGLAGFVRAHGLAARFFARARAALSSANPSESALVSALEALNEANRGRWQVGREVLARAESAMTGWADPHMQRMLLTTRGHLEYFSGDLEAALRTFETMLRSANEDRSTQHSLWARFSMARSLGRLGRPEEALTLLLEAREGLRRAPELQSEIICLGLLAAAQLAVGKFPEAEEAGRSAVEAINRAAPTSFVAMEGYRATALTLISLARRAPNAAAREDLVLAVKKVERVHGSLARLFPVARGTLEQVRGALASLKGQADQARRAFARAHAIALEFRMTADATEAAAALEQVTRGEVYR